MKIGFGFSEITPASLTKMAGYIDRHESAVGVHDKLFVKCAVISEFAIFSYDLLGISYELFKEVRSQLPNAILTATHTHSAPVLTSKYVDFLLNKTLKAYKMAVESMKDTEFLFSRFKVNGVCANRISHNFFGGNEAAILKCDKGGMIIYGCHSTVLRSDNLLYSSDLAGGIIRALEKKHKGTFLFLNSCAGDVSTRFTRKSRDFSAVSVLVKRFMNQLPNSFENLQGEIHFEKAKGVLKYKVKNPHDSMWWGIEIGKKYLDAEKDILTGETTKKKGIFPIEIDLLKIGKTIMMFYPFELQTFTCKKIENIGKRYNVHVLVVSYSNGYWGYLPASETLKMKIYENLVSVFGEKAEGKVLKLTEEVLKRACSA